MRCLRRRGARIPTPLLPPGVQLELEVEYEVIEFLSVNRFPPPSSGHRVDTVFDDVARTFFADQRPARQIFAVEKTA